MISPFKWFRDAVGGMRHRLQGRRPPPDLWNAYRIDLVVMHDGMKAASHANNLCHDPAVDELLSDRQAEPTWERLYEAEQRLARLMPDDQIRAEAIRRFVEAEKLDIPTCDALRAEYDSTFPNGQQTDNPGRRKQVFLRLLDEIHFCYIKRALDRSQRKRQALSLCYVGTAIAIVPSVFLFWIWLDGTLEPLARFHVPVIVWCGVMGAYFSRMVRFQGEASAIDYDALINGYSMWSLFVRLIIGALGALIMYFLILSDLIGGDIFPDLAEGPWDKADAKSVPLQKNVISTPPVSSTYAKLLIWCTLSGFSERLIPDRLTALGEGMRDPKPSGP